jgi:hypothetical protein
MKKLLCCLMLPMLCAAALQAAPLKKATAAAAAAKVFMNIYTEQKAADNHYSPTGWMGDTSDLKLDPGCTVNPHSGKSCIKISYNAKASQNAGWVGIYWQHPGNNWGTKKGFNLTGAKRLTFWARGTTGAEKINEFKIGGITGPIADSDMAVIGPETLTSEWVQYSIDLDGKDLSNIAGGFCFSASKEDNPKGFDIYLDDMRIEQ